MTRHLRTVVAGAAFAAALLAPVTAFASDGTHLETIIVYGAVKSPDTKQTGEAASDRAIPALPVVYEATARKTDTKP